MQTAQNHKWADHKDIQAPLRGEVLFLPAIARWTGTYIAGLHQKLRGQLGEETDPYMQGNGENSPALERYRNFRAGQEELKLEEMRRNLISVALVNAVHAEWAGRLRKLLDELERRFPREVRETVAEALADCQRMIETKMPHGE